MRECNLFLYLQNSTEPTHTHIWLAARWNFENLFSFTILGSHSFVINLMLVCFRWGVSSLTSTGAFCTVRIFWYRYNAIKFWGGWLSIFGVQASGIDKWTQTPLQWREATCETDAFALWTNWPRPPLLTVVILIYLLSLISVYIFVQWNPTEKHQWNAQFI